MTVREKFDAQLEELKQDLLNLGKMAGSALKDAIEALKEQDIDKALRIIDTDYKINDLEEEINDKAIWMIAKEQPVATDLRRLITAIKISTDVERVGDLAVNIAKSVIRIGDEPLIKPLEDIPRMAEIAQKMINDVLKAYFDEDVAAAKTIADVDDEVDQLYGRVVKELLAMMTKRPDAIAQITQLTFIGRHIERVGDHVTNISENILYLVKGKRYDLNN